MIGRRMNYIFSILIVLNVGCSDSETPTPANADFEQVAVDKILGYHIEGQEQAWGNQNISMINVYQDAIVFQGDRSVDASFIGFAYGYDDLSAYEVTCENCAAWSSKNDELSIRSKDGAVEIWKILEIKQGLIVVLQQSNNETFSLKVMN
jgi:hypothetical protein